MTRNDFCFTAAVALTSVRVHFRRRRAQHVVGNSQGLVGDLACSVAPAGDECEAKVVGHGLAG